MSIPTSRHTILSGAQSVSGLTASLLAIAWTLSRWGVTETIYGVAPLLLTLACVFAILASLVLIAWLTRKWGVGETLRGVAPWLLLVASASMTLAALAVLAAALQTYGLANTVCTLTCLVWLLDYAARRLSWVWKHCRERGKGRAADGAPAVPAAGEPARVRPVAIPVGAVESVQPARPKGVAGRPVLGSVPCPAALVRAGIHRSW